MAQLAVKALEIEDTWKDIVRINKSLRHDIHGRFVRRGTPCALRKGRDGPCKWVVVHSRESPDAVSQMDLNVRLALDVREGEICEFSLETLSWIRSHWFPWWASDPIYRLPAQLGLLSAAIGTVLAVLGIVVGLVPLFKRQ